MSAYPVVIHKDKRSDYGVTVPDLPGCFSAGKTLDDALSGAKEAIELHVEGLIAEGLPVPSASTVDRYQADREYAGGVWGVVSIDDAALRQRAVRINITVPERVLDAVDRFATQIGETRSGLLVRAVTQFMGREPGRSSRAPKAKARRKR